MCDFLDYEIKDKLRMKKFMEEEALESFVWPVLPPEILTGCSFELLDMDINSDDY